MLDAKCAVTTSDRAPARPFAFTGTKSPFANGVFGSTVPFPLQGKLLAIAMEHMPLGCLDAALHDADLRKELRWEAR